MLDFQVDDDHVLDLKYVRHAPRLYKHTEVEMDDVKSDGSLKVKLGRLSVVLLYKMAVDLQHFLEPLMRPGLVPHWVGVGARLLERGAGRLRTWPTRLHVSLDLHLPALLLPQKSASPNLVIANLGEYKPRHSAFPTSLVRTKVPLLSCCRGAYSETDKRRTASPLPPPCLQ